LQDGKVNSVPGAKRTSSSSHQFANSRKNGGHGRAQDIAPESVIPMGENRIIEHNEELSDF
jgi:hypothetical protein